ncbi:NTP transferase domain-containing protein [Candidatus Woesearchaeota archaeon]|nr:NTP transferase domain-containing protein [Candidatus Woesearchaeota archaeon]
MKAIILAAGQGKRLLPLTNELPKCLLEVKEKSLIEIILDRVSYAGIKDVIIVIGFGQSKIIDKFGTVYKGMDIEYIYNPIYAKTNCIYSLWLAREQLIDGGIIINGDTIFNENILKSLLSTKHKNAAVVDMNSTRLDEDAMKVTIKNNCISEISKNIPFETSQGHAIGVYKFSKEGMAEYFKEIETLVNSNITNINHLVPLNNFVNKYDLNIVSTNGLSWTEIDRLLDFKKAQRTFELIEQEEENIRLIEEAYKNVPIKEILIRRSIRMFKENDYINKQQIMTLLEAARWAPSAKNIQALEFIIIDDIDIKEKLSVYCQQIQPKVCPTSILVIGDLELAGRVGEISTHSCTTKERGQNMFIYMDAAAAIQNMLLTATALNIDSLWISSFNDKKIIDLFNLHSNWVPLALICLGHRTKPPFNPPKRSISERIYLNKFEERNKDFSYLEICKKINEENGEYIDAKNI